MHSKPGIINVCDIGIHNVSLDEAADFVVHLVEKKQQAFIVTPNTDHIVKLQKDKEFKHIYNNAALVVADGMPLLWAAKFLGTPLKEKVSGSDLLPKLCEIAAKNEYRLFFFGR